MVPTDGERTLTGTIVPPGVACVHSVNMLATTDRAELLSLAASFISLPMDAYVRQLGKGHLLPALMSGLPLLHYGDRKDAAFARVLALNCLTTPYAEFWNDHFRETFTSLEWIKSALVLKKRSGRTLLLASISSRACETIWSVSGPRRTRCPDGSGDGLDTGRAPGPLSHAVCSDARLRA